MAGEPILIIDDNATNLKLVRVLLSCEGYNIRTAADAEEGIKVIDTFRPKLILMDIQLPGMDGLELTRRLKANPEKKDIIILALSAYAMKGDEKKALTAGCDGYITKPIDPDSLIEIIVKYLSREA